MRVESRLSWLAAAAGSTLCLAVATIGADARWLAALGGAIVRAGHIPTTVPYAAAPSDWVNVPVLGELLFHWLDALGGERGFVAGQAVAVALMFALLLRDMRAAGAGDAARALVLVAMLFAAASALLVVRAQMLSLPLFALLVVLLRAEARRPSRALWLLVPLVASWSNLHGAVLTGLALASVYLLFERARRTPWTAVGVLASSWAALFATPALTRTGDYYVGVLHSAPAATGVGLWAPLSLHNVLDVVFIVIAVPLVWLAVRARPRPWELVALVLLTAATFHAGRNGVWLVLFAAAPAACSLRMHAFRPVRGLALSAWAVPVVLLLSAFARAPAQSVANERLRAEAARLAHGRAILADAEDAEQLALDGRRVWIANPIDAFDRHDQQLYLDWLRGRPPGDVLPRARGVVLVQAGTEPQRRLARAVAFREVARDAVAVLYARVS
jgi:hypothetical protein